MNRIIIIKIAILLTFLLCCFGCSSNEELSSLNEDKVESLKLIVQPIFCNEEILAKENIEEDDYDNYEILFYSDNKSDISTLIKSLKDELPKMMDVFGSSYGEPIIRLKVKIRGKEENIGIIPTDGIENVLAEKLKAFNYIVLKEYILYEKEIFHDLINYFNESNIEYYIWHYNYDDKINKKIDKYTLIIENYSKKSYSESKKVIKNFININQDVISSYFISKIFSTYKTDDGEIKKGFPTSAHLYIKEKDALISMFESAKELGLLRGNKELIIIPISIYIDDSKIEESNIFNLNLRKDI